MNCCGDQICGDFEQFYCQFLKLMPENEICKNGDFYKLLRVVAEVFYKTLYDAPGGICYLKKEADPMTADLTIDLWMQIYGIDDRLPCELDPLAYPDEYRISKAARLRAHEILKWFDGNDDDLFQLIADQFGLTIETFVPTYIFEGMHYCEEPLDQCHPIIGDFDTECICDSDRREFDSVVVGMSPNCMRYEKKIGIVIKASPEPLYPSACHFYAGDRVCCNVWVEGFKQTIRKYFSQKLRFCDEWQGQPYNQAPVI